MRALWFALLCGVIFVRGTSVSTAGGFLAGVARIEVTPSEPIRLSGYGNRTNVSQGVAQPLWAKALAIGQEDGNPAVLVTVDNCGVSGKIADEVASRLLSKGVARECFALCSTHTHTGPCLSGVLPNLFSRDIAPDEQATIDRYTRELTDRLEQVCLAALIGRTPARLAWGEGKVSFAKNRRTSGGPVDHALPVLRVSDTNGHVRAILVSYACHCTTLFGEHNQVHGDWAGCAQEAIQQDFPGAVALVAIGCGADANPDRRGHFQDARDHGEAIAAEVRRLLAGPLKPITGPLVCRAKRIELLFQKPFTREEWERRAGQAGIVGYHARKNLARLDHGETLPTTLPYLVQTWTFGRQLAMVFLPGEVVVDYSRRLKSEFDRTRLWINAYANDVPCYIPSRRILEEGGYEAEDSLWYYDRPARLAPETENLIIRTVHELLPEDFLAK